MTPIDLFWTLMVFAGVAGLATTASWLFVQRYTWRTEPAVVLALFRIAYATVLLGEVVQLLACREVLSAVELPRPNWVCGTGSLLCWLVTLIALIAGYRTRIAVGVNYLMSLAWFGADWDLTYHADYIYLVVNTVLLAAPVARCWSLDAVRTACMNSPVSPRVVSAVWSRLLVLTGIGFIYLDSVFYKW